MPLNLDVSPESAKVINETLADAAFYVSDYPALFELCNVALQDGDPEAAEHIRKVGVAIADVLYYSAFGHEGIRQVLEDADAMPISLSPFKDSASQHIDNIYEHLRFGKKLSCKITHSKGGPKRFRSVSAPSSVAYGLYLVMEPYVIPESETDRREAKRLAIRNAIDNLDKNDPDFLKKLEKWEFEKAITFLPTLTEETSWKWAEVGAQAMVDFREWVDDADMLPVNQMPSIPEKWIAAAAKRKGKTGALRDMVCKNLESGFKSIARG